MTEVNANKIELRIDTIDLHQGLRENMLKFDEKIKTATDKMLDDIGSRFCQCCFFGHVEGQIDGEYLCGMCAYKLYGFNPKTGEMKPRNLTYQLWYRKRQAFDPFR